MGNGHADEDQLILSYRGDFPTINLFQMPLNFASGHTSGIEGNDLVIEPIKASLMLLDELGLEVAATITRHVYLELATLAF